MKIRKITSLILALVMILSLAACGGAAETPTEAPKQTEVAAVEETPSVSALEAWHAQDPVIIGVCFAQMNDEYNNYKTYLESYVAPAFNLKFIFSEAVTDLAAEIAFLETCSAQGAQGFIDFCGNDTVQIVDRCEQYEMYVMFQTTLKPGEWKEICDNEYYVGTAYADPAAIGVQYAGGLQAVMEGQELEGLILATAVAAKGNNQHIETGVNILNGLSQMNGITYTMELRDIVTSSAATDVENSGNLPIHVYPGTPANVDGYLAGLSALLMTGKYNVVISSTTGYAQMMTVIDEAEKALNKDIKLISVAAVGADLQTAMTNKDSFGNLTLDAAIIKPGTWIIGGLVAPLVNAISGHTEAYKDADGNSTDYVGSSFLVTTTEAMEAINSKDVAAENSWVMQNEHMEQMLAICNEGITQVDVAAYFGQDLNELMK